MSEKRMHLGPLFDKQSLIDCLKSCYEIYVVELAILPLGAGLDSFVLKAVAQDKSCYFIKLKLFFDPVGIAIANLLCESGIKQIIQPIKTIHGEQSKKIGTFTLIVYPFIEGQNGFSCELSKEQWVLFGQALRQVHEITVPHALLKQIRHELYSNKWRVALNILLKEDISSLMWNEYADNFWHFFKQNKALIRRLLCRTEELSGLVKVLTPPLVLCHSDIHAGNLLIGENQSLYIVGWDDPIMAPKERDLMFIGGGVAKTWNKPHEEKAFYAGYGTTDVNPTIQAYYRHERIVEDIVLYCSQMSSTTEIEKDKAELFQQFVTMFEPLGVIDRVFSTDVTRI